MTSRGRRLDPERPTRVALHHGVNIMVAGEHLNGGNEHTVPFHIANELVASGRAHYPAPVADTTADVAAPEHRDPTPESADPAELRRRRK